MHCVKIYYGYGIHLPIVDYYIMQFDKFFMLKRHKESIFHHGDFTLLLLENGLLNEIAPDLLAKLAEIEHLVVIMISSAYGG